MLPTLFVFLSPPSTVLHTRFLSGLQNWAENEQERREAQEKNPLGEAAAYLLGSTLWLHSSVSVFDSKSFFSFIHCSSLYTQMQKEKQRVSPLNNYAICLLNYLSRVSIQAETPRERVLKVGRQWLSSLYLLTWVLPLPPVLGVLCHKKSPPWHAPGFQILTIQLLMFFFPITPSFSSDKPWNYRRTFQSNNSLIVVGH